MVKETTKRFWKTATSIVIILILIGSLVLFTVGDLSVTNSGTLSSIEVDTQIQCDTTTVCVENPDLIDIKDVVYCAESTCRFERINTPGVIV